MPERENTCCFTGHREYKLPWGSDENDPRCRKLQQQLFDAVDAVYAAGIRHFICGMANGCDLYFFDAARYLRLQHPEVTIEAAIPYSGQADRWRPVLLAAASCVMPLSTSLPFSILACILSPPLQQRLVCLRLGCILSRMRRDVNTFFTL